MRHTCMAAAIGILAVGCAGSAGVGGPTSSRWSGTKPVVAFTNPKAFEPQAGSALTTVSAAPSPSATKPVVAFTNPSVAPVTANAIPARGCAACAATSIGTKPVVAFTAPPRGCGSEEARHACAQAAAPCPACVAAK